MGHYIDAIVGLKSINEKKAQDLGLALIYESEFVIIPLIEENIYHFEIENKIDSENFGDDVNFDCTSTLIIAELLGLKEYVLMTLNNPYFLGSCYNGKNKIHHEIDINLALNYLRVPKKDGSEFNYLNLDEYRNSEFYYMDKIIGHENTVNIIKGTKLTPNWNKA